MTSPVPPEPEYGCLLLDCEGSVWRHRPGGWYDVAAPPDQMSWSWPELHSRFSPLESFIWWDYYPKEATA